MKDAADSYHLPPVFSTHARAARYTSWRTRRSICSSCRTSIRSCRLVSLELVGINTVHSLTDHDHRAELENNVEARQKLESQLQENKGVQKVN